MELGGESSGAKPTEVHLEEVGLHHTDTDSSQLSVSTASNTTLPHLEPIDGERVLNEEDKRKKKEARNLKREAREKKKERQLLDEKKARKETRRLKREERRKIREARKKKEEAKAPNTSSSELSSSSKDGDESYQVHSCWVF